MRTEMRTESKT